MTKLNASGQVGLSAAIVAMNEEDRIGDCLASLEFCDEILVVDSHSTDRTREIARQHGARVVERDWPGMIAQRQFSIDEAEYDFVLCLDADERVSPKLREELIELREAGLPNFAGWAFPRVSNLLGVWTRPDVKRRFVDRRRTRVIGVPPHEVLEVDGPTGRLKGDLIHYPYRSLADHLGAMDRYSSIAARAMHERGRRASAIDLLLRPAGRFLRSYVIERGFLQGWRGLLLAQLLAHYAILKYGKLLCLKNGLAID